MKQTTLFALLGTLLVGLLGGYIIAKQGREGYAFQSPPMGMHRMADGTLMNNNGMMGHMMNMSVKSEQEFIEGMIPHHQEAVDSAKDVLARGGTTPEIRTLLQNIVQAQEAEIASMKAWYSTWYGKTYSDTGTYQPMMRDASALSGKALDAAFLEDMIMHHMGAIMMARSVQPYVTHTEIRSLTDAIARTQSEEIMQMQRMLSAL